MKTGLQPHPRTDRLRAVFVEISTGKMFIQAKRVPKDTDLTKEEIHWYAHGHATQAVKSIMARKECSLSVAWNLLKTAAGRV